MWKINNNENQPLKKVEVMLVEFIITCKTGYVNNPSCYAK